MADRVLLFIIKRVPKLQQIAPVYAVIVMMVYGWTIYWYLWKFPSWTYYLSLPDILSILAYSLSTNIIESLAILAILIVLCILLPRNWFYDSFIVRGSVAVILLLGYLMYFSSSFKTIEVKDYPQTLANWSPVVIALTIAFLFLVVRMELPSRAIKAFSERAVIFLYISIPVSLIALLYVVVRNIFWVFING